MEYQKIINLLDNTPDQSSIYLVMLMYNLIEYNDNYLKKSGSLWQHNRDEPSLNNDDAVIDFDDNDTGDLFKLNKEITNKCQWHKKY